MALSYRAATAGLLGQQGRNTTNCECHSRGWETLLSAAVFCSDKWLLKVVWVTVSEVSFDPMMRTRWAKDEQHRPCNQESTSTKRKVFVRYYSNKPKAAWDLTSLLKTLFVFPKLRFTNFIHLSKLRNLFKMLCPPLRLKIQVSHDNVLLNALVNII